MRNEMEIKMRANKTLGIWTADQFHNLHNDVDMLIELYFSIGEISYIMNLCIHDVDY